MSQKKSRMPELGEAIFSIIYLIFGFIAATILLALAQGRTVILLYGIMTFVLAAGDSFHLVPRILHALRDDFQKYEFWAGLGLMISSITMTIFYLLLYRVWQELFGESITVPPIFIGILFGCAIIRIVLCLFPQNNWFRKEGNPTWGILRNVPFVVVGLIMIILFAISGMWNMAIAIFISFACYMPVVLYGKKNPKIGMLMIPKTIAYMWMICIGLCMLS